jgi:hypothetical protein
MKNFFNEAASALKAFESKVSAQLEAKGSSSELVQAERYTVSTYFWDGYSADLTAIRIMQYRVAKREIGAVKLVSKAVVVEA